MPTLHNSLTDISGLRVGHWTNLDAATGCTVILCPAGAVAGVDVRGGAPGTRELALLDPVCAVESVHAVLLTGGSAFGLAAADGVVRWLEEHGYGYDVGVAKVPIVPAAVLFDLAVGQPNVRPDAAAGYASCEAASDGPVAEGRVGAGTGATVGKMLGLPQASPGGLGTASRQIGQGQIGQGLIVAALVAVNAVGSVMNPANQQVVAGARLADGRFADPRQLVENRLMEGALFPGTNTTIAVVATNAKLSKAEATKVAQMAHDGLARVINPIHTAADGDTIFALSLGAQSAPASLVGAMAAEVLSEAVLRAVQEHTEESRE